MKEITLTQGRVALVDDEDFDWVSAWKWHARKSFGGFYAARTTSKGGKVFLHRAILKAPTGMYVDHINGDSLDNRRANLRLVTHQQNMMNRVLSSSNTSRFKGVYWQNRGGRWIAKIKYNQKIRHIGTFLTEEDAARAYDTVARELFGDYGRFNFPAAGEFSAQRDVGSSGYA